MSPPVRVLITGATGFTGRHLCAVARDCGATVFGLARRGPFPAGVHAFSGDVTDPAALEAVLTTCRPDWIFHLAALVHGRGDASADEMLRVALHGTDRLLHAVRAIVPAARILVASSSGIYGEPADASQPIAETAPLQPASTYAVAKATQDLLAVQYHRQHGLHTVRARPFNLTGPGEPAGLVCAALARQIARIEAGRAEPVVRVVTLRPARDFCDVRDVAAGFWAILAHGTPGEAYNLCSGISRRIGEVLETLLALSHRHDIRVDETQPVPPPGAILTQTGDPSRLGALTGWAPRFQWEQSLTDLLDDWRARIDRES